MKRATPLLALLMLATTSLASIHHVPANFPTIQAAMDSALEGDTVLVAEGTYAECVRFRETNLVLASEFLLDGDLDHITNTIIDASTVATPDTGSCVLVVNGQDSTSAVIGFTLTGGIGTPLFDPPTNATYREGGGILIEESSPLIAWNHIVDNEAVSKDGGMRSAGGGGLRTGFGAPIIEHNIFENNRGLYGAGITINYAHATFRNNLVINNEGGQEYGGAGVWITGPGYHSIIANNTIVGNISLRGTGAWNGRGGGILCYDTNAEIFNNIVWGNQADGLGDQIALNGGTVTVQYNCVMDGIDGEGNIDLFPAFNAEAGFILPANSPCVDGGNPDPAFNDPENSENPGTPLLPAQGTLRSDIGLSGGPYAASLPVYSYGGLSISPVDIILGSRPVGNPTTRIITAQSRSSQEITLLSSDFNLESGDGLSFDVAFPFTLPSFQDTVLTLSWTPGIPGPVAGNIAISHDDTVSPSPILLNVTGNAIGTDAPDEGDEINHGFFLAPSHPNPFNPSTTIEFSLSRPGHAAITVFNNLGQEVQRLAGQDFAAGGHYVQFDASGLAGGMYYVSLNTDEGSRVQPVLKLP